MDDTTPATKGDLKQLEQAVFARFDQIDEKFQKIDQQFNDAAQQISRLNRGFDRMHEDIDSVLNMLINKQKVSEDHEERLITLEQTLVA